MVSYFAMQKKKTKHYNWCLLPVNSFQMSSGFWVSFHYSPKIYKYLTGKMKYGCPKWQNNTEKYIPMMKAQLYNRLHSCEKIKSILCCCKINKKPFVRKIILRKILIHFHFCHRTKIHKSKEKYLSENLSCRIHNRK